MTAEWSGGSIPRKRGTKRCTFGGLKVGDKFIPFLIEPNQSLDVEHIHDYASQDFDVCIKIEPVRRKNASQTETRIDHYDNAVLLKNGQLNSFTDSDLVIKISY